MPWVVDPGVCIQEDRKRNADRILSSALCRIVSYRIVSRRKSASQDMKSPTTWTLIVSHRLPCLESYRIVSATLCCIASYLIVWSVFSNGRYCIVSPGRFSKNYRIVSYLLAFSTNIVVWNRIAWVLLYI